MTMWDVICALHFSDLVVLGHKCETHECTDVACWRIFWPGREPSLKCERHLGWCVHVAEALGFTLHCVAVSVREYPEPHPTSVRASLLEME